MSSYTNIEEEILAQNNPDEGFNAAWTTFADKELPGIPKGSPAWEMAKRSFYMGASFVIAEVVDEDLPISETERRITIIMMQIGAYIVENKA